MTLHVTQLVLYASKMQAQPFPITSSSRAYGSLHGTVKSCPEVFVLRSRLMSVIIARQKPLCRGLQERMGQRQFC